MRLKGNVSIQDGLGNTPPENEKRLGILVTLCIPVTKCLTEAASERTAYVGVSFQKVFRASWERRCGGRSGSVHRGGVTKLRGGGDPDTGKSRSDHTFLSPAIPYLKSSADSRLSEHMPVGDTREFNIPCWFPEVHGQLIRQNAFSPHSKVLVVPTLFRILKFKDCPEINTSS